MTFRLRIIKSVLFCLFAVFLAGTVVAAAEIKLGDTDIDGDVTIIDATCIQRSLAGLAVSGEFSRQAADVDGSGDIEITDATFIQRWLAEIPTPYPIGEEIESSSEPPTQPTEPSSQPTESPTQRPTDEEGWGHDVFRP
ncbi:MAG: hypothetical protein IJH07_07965 [Ruminococcus sp.]|nr:hypothetical protein [Ruminococcus sp.]